MVSQTIEKPAPDVAGLFRALGDPTRLAIVDHLRDGPRSVGQIAGRFPISRPAVSKHLSVLRGAHLVSEEPVGRERIYRLSPMALRQVDLWLERYRLYWTARLLDLKAFVEDEERSDREQPAGRAGKGRRR
jgi:DNA-binding transcriptional ArsR family regulator